MILRAFFACSAAALSLAAGIAQAQQVPFEIARLQKDFPVTLYSGASCKNACDDARAALNKRSIPFTETVVAPDEESIAKLRAISGSNQLPVLTVGRSVQIGSRQASTTRCWIPPAIRRRAPIRRAARNRRPPRTRRRSRRHRSRPRSRSPGRTTPAA
jgi:glutaredoxin